MREEGRKITFKKAPASTRRRPHSIEFARTARWRGVLPRQSLPLGFVPVARAFYFFLIILFPNFY